MNRYYFLWIVLIALLCLILTLFAIWHTISPPPPAQKFITPIARPPFTSYISGVGIVEASSDNISIGTSVNRLVDKVLVTAGTKVKKGNPLFKLEDQDLQAELQTRKIAYDITLARLQKLEALPRQEELIAAEADLKKAEVDRNQAKTQYDMVQGLEDSRALSLQEINRRRFNFEQAEANSMQAKAHYDQVKDGTWKPDLKIAYLETQQAKANIEQIEAEINRTIITSPIDGEVLQVTIHKGELPSSSSAPLMVVGNIDEMYLKVSINQFDAPYFESKAPAVAYLRGNARVEYPLEFVRLDPYLVYKHNLTNDITEKFDTRVLQVIYRIKNVDHNIFVGQQMDAFIEAKFPP